MAHPAQSTPSKTAAPPGPVPQQQTASSARAKPSQAKKTSRPTFAFGRLPAELRAHLARQLPLKSWLRLRAANRMGASAAALGCHPSVANQLLARAWHSDGASLACLQASPPHFLPQWRLLWAIWQHGQNLHSAKPMALDNQRLRHLDSLIAQTRSLHTVEITVAQASGAQVDRLRSVSHGIHARARLWGLRYCAITADRLRPARAADACGQAMLRLLGASSVAQRLRGLSLAPSTNGIPKDFLRALLADRRLPSVELIHLDLSQWSVAERDCLRDFVSRVARLCHEGVQTRECLFALSLPRMTPDQCDFPLFFRTATLCAVMGPSPTTTWQVQLFAQDLATWRCALRLANDGDGLQRLAPDDALPPHTPIVLARRAGLDAPTTRFGVASLQRDATTSAPCGPAAPLLVQF